MAVLAIFLAMIFIIGFPIWIRDYMRDHPPRDYSGVNLLDWKPYQADNVNPLELEEPDKNCDTKNPSKCWGLFSGEEMVSNWLNFDMKEILRRKKISELWRNRFPLNVTSEDILAEKDTTVSSFMG